MIAEFVNYQDLYGKDKSTASKPASAWAGTSSRTSCGFSAPSSPYFKTPRGTSSSRRPLEEGDYTQKYHYWNFQAKLTAQPLKFMRVGASFVNNFNKYKGALPNRDGTERPDRPLGRLRLQLPPVDGVGLRRFHLGQQPARELPRRFLLHQHRPTSRSNPKGPATIMSGTGPGGLPEDPCRIPETRRLVELPLRPLVDGAVSGRESHVDGDATYFLNLAGEHSWKFGVSWTRLSEDTLNGYKYPTVHISSWLEPPARHLGGVNYGRGKYGYYRSGETRRPVRSGIFTMFSATAGPSIFRTVGRSPAGSP